MAEMTTKQRSEFDSINREAARHRGKQMTPKQRKEFDALNAPTAQQAAIKTLRSDAGFKGY